MIRGSTCYCSLFFINYRSSIRSVHICNEKLRNNCEYNKELHNVFRFIMLVIVKVSIILISGVIEPLEFQYS